jgi:Flp pilus assembly protein TadD
LRAKRYEEAASFFAQAVQANPRFSYLYADLAAALALAGRTAEAQVAARRALELEPGFRAAALGPFALPELRNEQVAGWRKAGLPE